MNNRPNPSDHMVLWGIISGQILAMVSLVFVTRLSGSAFNPLDLLVFLVNPYHWWLAFIFGALPGGFAGWATGTILWRMIPERDTFSEDDMQDKRLAVYGVVGLVTFILPIMMGYPFWMAFSDAPALTVAYRFLYGFPPLIGALAMAHASHRYLMMLRIWSERQTERKAKEKLKNEELAIYHRAESFLMQYSASTIDEDRIAQYRDEVYQAQSRLMRR